MAPPCRARGCLHPNLVGVSLRAGMGRGCGGLRARILGYEAIGVLSCLEARL